MLDALFLVVSVLFFVVAAAYHERLRPAEEIMTLDSIVSLVVTAGLLAYLTFALLKPEKF